MILMDRIRSRAAAIFAIQQRQYSEERRALERRAWEVELALAAGVALCLTVIAWLFALRGREVDRRRQLEEELRAFNLELEDRVAERTAQLKASEERASLIVDTALDAVITIDKTGAITGWNPQAVRIFGWTRGEALGRPVDETIMPERYRQAHRAGLARYLATGEANVLNKRIELVALRRSGREFPVELTIAPLHRGDSVTFSAFVRDLSQQKTRDEQIRQLQRMDAIGRLTGGDDSLRLALKMPNIAVAQSIATTAGFNIFEVGHEIVDLGQQRAAPLDALGRRGELTDAEEGQPADEDDHQERQRQCQLLVRQSGRLYRCRHFLKHRAAVADRERVPALG
jgi:PAS domain S-box-containing protein